MQSEFSCLAKRFCGRDSVDESVYDSAGRGAEGMIVQRRAEDMGWWLVVLASVIVAAFTIFALAQSAESGRLSTAPAYDDAVYFRDAAIILREVRAGGLGGACEFIGEWAKDPSKTSLLHSPYSALMATAAFGAFGPAPIAAYASNGVVVAFFVGGLGWILRRLPPGVWLLSIGIFLSLPFASMAVAEFRPDLLWGIFTGFGVVFTICEPRVFRLVGASAVAGVLLAAALLVKPTTFAMTLVVFGSAVAGRWIVDALPGDGRIWPRVPAVAGYLLAAILPVLPYAAWHWRKTWHYFYMNSFGVNRDVWLHPGDLAYQLGYYAIGPGAVSNLGYTGFVWAAMTLACVAMVIAKASFRSLVRGGVVFGIIALAYIFNTLGNAKTPFLGAAIYGIAFFGSAWLLQFAWERITAQNRTAVASGCLAVCFVVSILLWRWPTYSTWTPDEAIAHSTATSGTIAAIESSEPTLPESIFFTKSSPVTPENIEAFLAWRDQPARVAHGTFVGSIERLKRVGSDFDWIVVAEGEPPYPDAFPVSKLEADFLQYLQTGSGRHEIAKFKAGSQTVRIFARP